MTTHTKDSTRAVASIGVDPLLAVIETTTVDATSTVSAAMATLVAPSGEENKNLNI